MALVLLSSLWLTTQGQTSDDYVNFLYQYMPLPDKTDYPLEFYQQNVSLSLTARAAMPWGEDVPEREFKHFVVPVRGNNEKIHMSSDVFYKE